MAWKNDLQEPYDVAYNFTEDELISIRPEDVASYMNLQTYGTSAPDITDRPTHCRSTNLEFIKKSISYFSPNRNASWNVEHKSGNPTRSVVVNNVIKGVRLFEVRKEGLPSSAKRDMKRAEFELTMHIFETGGNDSYKTRVLPTMMKLQYHLIGRTDDISNIETDDIHSHPKFSDFALETEVSWSKNVMDERECPPQIIVGSQNPKFCCLVSLASHLESRLSSNDQSRFLFGSTGRVDDDEPNRINDKYTKCLRQVWKNNQEMRELLVQNKGGLGSHSIRKFGATWSAEHGCSYIEVEIRGRWRGKKNGRVVNRYINPEQLPIDTKVAGILTVGGPVKYKVKEDSYVTHQFLIDSVVPSIAVHYTDESNHIASVLGPALLWACHTEDDCLQAIVPDDLRERVKSTYNNIRGGHPGDYNPVEKLPLHIYRVENEVHIEEMITMLDGGVREGVGQGGMQFGGTAGGQQAIIEQHLQSTVLAQHRIETLVRENHAQVQVRFALF